MKQATRTSRLVDLLGAIRVHQWIKNLIIPAVGLLMLRKGLGDGTAILGVAYAFAAFCLAASSIYIFNDIMDIEKDRQHPVKRMRPIASGRLGLPLVWACLALLVPASLALAFAAGTSVVAMLLAYLAINLAYCLKFKHVAQVDVICVSSGFTIRALTGAFAVGMTIDFWLLAAITFACMGLALMKRMKEFKAMGASGKTRPALAGYDYETLVRTHDMFMVLAVLSAVLFVNNNEKVSHNAMASAFALTMVSSLFLIFVHRVQGDADGDPTALVYRNKYLSTGAVLMVVVFLFLL